MTGKEGLHTEFCWGNLLKNGHLEYQGDGKKHEGGP